MDKAVTEGPAGRPHTWVDKTKTPSLWEDRACLVCKLEDTRDKDPKAPFRKWRVTTPCIEPVPELVSCRDLERELDAHGVRERPLCIGSPTSGWVVGFSIGGRGYNVYPRIEVKGSLSLEHAFADLTRWIRARQYEPDRYSDFSYARQLADSSCACGDDD